MRRGRSDPNRYTPERNRLQKPRYKKWPGRRFAWIPALAAVAVVGTLLAVFLPGWLNGGNPGPADAPATARTEAPPSTASAPVESTPSAMASQSEKPLPSDTPAMAMPQPIIDAAGMTIGERFRPPEGFRRVAAQPGSFAEYLRNYPLRPDGAKVQYYDGSVKPDYAYLAVADMDLGGSRLQQCADTVLRIHAEYLYGRGGEEAISYHFVSGFEFRWDKWRQGYRVKVDGNRVSWVRSGRADGSEQAFKAYLQQLFNYASTLSLERYDTMPVGANSLAIGDMFLHGGSPGHVVLVVDMAEEPSTGRKCFILLQGYMPAQDAQILRNLSDDAISPWVMLPKEPSGDFQTPEYLFTWNQVRRFKE